MFQQHLDDCFVTGTDCVMQRRPASREPVHFRAVFEQKADNSGLTRGGFSG
jgi:hypothetical protein